MTGLRANAGYHIEGSYAGPDGQGRVNIRSRARGLLALFLLTDVGPDDAPTRLMAGSHLYVPEFLAPHGEAGADSDGVFWRESVLCRTAAHATGQAGDVPRGLRRSPLIIRVPGVFALAG